MLILQRLDDLRAAMRAEIANLRGEMNGLRTEVREDIRSVRAELGAWRAWTIGVLLLAILGLTVKLFLPSL